MQLENNRISGLGWTEEEQLLSVLEDGSTVLYDVQGRTVKTFSLFSRTMTKDRSVLNAVVWGVGMVALTNQMVIHACDNVGVSSPQVYAMRTGLSSARPATAMVVLEPRFTSSGHVEVILSSKDSSIIVVDRNSCEDQMLQGRLTTPVLDMAVAPNGRFLACFTTSGVLTVLSTSFTTKVLDFDTSTTNRPSQMAWCGEDSIVLHWHYFLLMIGPYGHWLKFSYSLPLHIVAESDCCRIVSKNTCELLRRVPGPIETIHRIGSTDLAAMLYDAMEAFDDGDPKADEHMRSMHPPCQIMHAVRACISAAAAELVPCQQKTYLRAASYGKSFSSFGRFAANVFADTCRKLRVLNQLRRADPGMPLTSHQYEFLTPPIVIRRLLSRRRHALALRISEHLGVRSEGILVDWACMKLTRSSNQSSDEAIRDSIHSGLKKQDAFISYVTLAAAAGDAERRRLATMLLDFEVNAVQQVKLLLNMPEYELAVQKAINSLEVDIMYLALCTFDRSRKPRDSHHDHHEGQKKKAVEDGATRRRPTLYPIARNLLIDYYLYRAGCNGDWLRARNFLLAVGQSYADAGDVVISVGYNQVKLSARLEHIHEAARIFGLCRSDSQFELRVTEEQISLTLAQLELEKRFGIECFFDMSIAETVYNLVALSVSQPDDAQALQNEAQQICRRFKVPERRFYYVKIRALAASGQLDLLRAFADEKKSPVGYVPFLRACTANNHPPSECEVYVSRLPSIEERFEYYMRLKLWQRAADAACRLKDIDRLNQVGHLCTDERVLMIIEQFKAKT